MAVRVLNEKWPAAVDQFLSSEAKKKLANVLKNKGLDIENTESEIIQINNNRDPRLKSGVIIVKFNDAGGRWSKGPKVGVWLDGQCIQDALLGTDSNYRDILASKQSWKNLLNRSDIEVYRMTIDPETAMALQAKRTARGNAKRGTELRFRNYEVPSSYNPDTKYTIQRDEFGNTPRSRYGNRIDKSGYVLPSPDKYRNMLADLQVKDSDNILQRAADLYAKLSSQLMSRRGERQGFGGENYRSLLRRIPDLFYDLSDAKEEYEKEKDRWGDKIDPRNSYARSRIQSILKELREVLKYADKYVNVE